MTENAISFKHFAQCSLISFSFESFQTYAPSQNWPVICMLHPLSHIPVDLLQGAPSLQIPGHLVHCPFETYAPSPQTITSQQLNSYMNI